MSIYIDIFFLNSTHVLKKNVYIYIDIFSNLGCCSFWWAAPISAHVDRVWLSTLTSGSFVVRLVMISNSHILCCTYGLGPLPSRLTSISFDSLLWHQDHLEVLLVDAPFLAFALFNWRWMLLLKFFCCLTRWLYFLRELLTISQRLWTWV